MKQFTAEYCSGDKFPYGTGICIADTIEELMENLFDRGYNFKIGEKEEIIDWSKTNKKKYYGMKITIYRGEPEMTEYTSF